MGQLREDAQLRGGGMLAMVLGSHSHTRIALLSVDVESLSWSPLVLVVAVSVLGHSKANDHDQLYWYAKGIYSNREETSLRL